MVDDIAIQEFVNALKGTPTDSNTTYSAKVSRVDKDGTVWVNLFGSEKETPTSSSSSEVKRGDSVNVSWRNNKLYVDGNYSNPSSGVESAKRVEGVANDAKQIADIAYEAANNAVADAERARVAAESAEADALSAAQSSASAGESASRAQAASEAAQSAALATLTTDTIHYLATSQGSGVTRGTTGWTTTVQTMTATNKYLWTYHTYTTAGGATRDTEPVITGTYGEKGADGTSVTILGSYNTLTELEQAHPAGTRGDAYMVSGDLYVWNGSAWENVGQIQGPQGAQGNSVTVSSIAYAVTSTESEPQSYPYSTVPTVPEGSWLWTKTTYSDGNVAITKSKQGVSGTNGTDGRDGRDGIDGTNGTNGISVSAVQPQYYLSTSSSEATGGSWSTSLTYVVGKFIWTRDSITYSDNSHGTSSAIYNQALTESCYNAAEALGLISEQQQYFYHDSLGAHVLSSPNTTGVRYRTDIEGAGLEINELSGSTEQSVAAFGANGTRIGLKDESYVQIDSNSVDICNGSTVLSTFTENGAELGKNKTTAEISLCGGVGLLQGKQFEGGGKGLVIISKNDQAYYTDSDDRSVRMSTSITNTRTSNNNKAEAFFIVDAYPRADGTNSADAEIYVGVDTYNDGRARYRFNRYGISAYDEHLSSERMNFNMSDGNLSIAGDIYPQNTKMADFVVEQGTFDIWTYRKWNSGIAECWGNYATTLTHYAQMFGGYAYYTSVAFPSLLFIERPNVTYSAYIQNGIALTGTVTTNSTKDTAYVYAVSSSSGSRATNWYIKAVGKWK